MYLVLHLLLPNVPMFIEMISSDVVFYIHNVFIRNHTVREINKFPISKDIGMAL